jgi:hypothetical protein
VSREQLAVELDLAWWQSALEHLLQGDAAKVAIDSATLSELESKFVAADAQIATTGAAALSFELADRWRKRSIRACY